MISNFFQTLIICVGLGFGIGSAYMVLGYCFNHAATIAAREEVSKEFARREYLEEAYKDRDEK